MKLTKFFKLAALTLLTGLSFTFFSCEQMAPNSAIGEESVQSRASAVTADGKTIYFLDFAENSANSLNKVTTKSKFINKSSGGSFVLKASTPQFNVAFKLLVPANSIDHSKTVSMTFDDHNNLGFTEVVFGPHGTQFSSPALLDIEASGLNLSGLNPNNVKLYYVNENGHWEEMVAGSVSVSIPTGTVYVNDAQIPHFSRYALAAD